MKSKFSKAIMKLAKKRIEEQRKESERRVIERWKWERRFDQWF